MFGPADGTELIAAHVAHWLLFVGRRRWWVSFQTCGCHPPPDPCIVHGVKTLPVVHHDAVGGRICPVAALARRVCNIQHASPMGSISAVYHSSGKVSRVSDREIGIAVRWGATSDCLLTRGYTLDRISSHSLRAGGAMAMKLSGASDSTIMRVGRWTSLTYLTYIHSQIGSLTAGLAAQMSTAFTFQNVG